MSFPIDVLVAEEISAAEAAELFDDFTGIGLAADVRVVATRRSVGDVGWLLLAILPVQPFVLEADLPAESYRQLLHVDLATVQRGPLHYDRHRHRWRSELDEATQTPSPQTSGAD